MWTLTALVACTDSTPDTETPVAIDTGTWTPPTHESLEPEMSPEQAVTTIEAHFSEGLPSPHVARAQYMAFMAQGDEVCPASETRLNDTKVPLDGCVAESGYGYGGIAVLLPVEDEGAQGYTLYGDFQLTDPEGHVFEAGGVVGLHLSEIDYTRTALVELTGSWVYPPSTEWLGEGYSGTLSLRYREGQENEALSVEGGWQTTESSVYSAGLLLDTKLCADGAAQGSVEVRDPSGGWWTLTYDDTCSGCAELTWADGSSAGAHCPDLSRLRTGVEQLWGG